MTWERLKAALFGDQRRPRAAAVARREHLKRCSFWYAAWSALLSREPERPNDLRRFVRRRRIERRVYRAMGRRIDARFRP